MKKRRKLKRTYHSTCCFLCPDKLCKLANPFMDVVYQFLRMKETTKVLTQSLYDLIWSCFSPFENQKNNLTAHTSGAYDGVVLWIDEDCEGF